MRRAARTDDNQTALVEYLRGLGASVAITSAVGDGFPDLVIGYRGVNYLAEIKDPAKPPSERKLTDAQIKFHAGWQGQIDVIETPLDCLELLKLVSKCSG